MPHRIAPATPTAAAAVARSGGMPRERMAITAADVVAAWARTTVAAARAGSQWPASSAAALSSADTLQRAAAARRPGDPRHRGADGGELDGDPDREREVERLPHARAHREDEAIHPPAGE